MRDRIDDEITFRKLEVLLAFMQTGSLAKAAEALNVSTVSVHRALHSLEQGVRCALFRHEGRNLRSTDAAQMLADVAQEVITLMSDGIRATREAAGYSSDRLKIGSVIVVEGFRARDGSTNASGGTVTFADGRRVFTASSEDTLPRSEK